MHRISERVFQAKADLEKCCRRMKELKAATNGLQGCSLQRTANAVEEELEYWKLRAESARRMLEVEGAGAASE